MKVVCRHTDGYVDGPLITTAAAAEQVFLAARMSLRPGKASPALTAKVEGDHWIVAEAPRPGSQDHSKRGGSDLVVSAGGGELRMTIRICDGAISEVAFNK